MNKDEAKYFQRRLSLRLFGQFSLVMFLETVGLGALYAGVYYLGHRVIVWRDSFSAVYAFFKLIDNYALPLLAVNWIITALITLLFYWNKSIGYINKITGAIDHTFQLDTELVKLPEPLKYVEDRLNQIKYDGRKNQQLAKEAEQRKNDLVVYLAHDLKTPLTSVLGYLTLLKDEPGISEETRQRYLDIAADKAERLEELINEFFEITRFNLNQLTLDVSKISLTRMLEQVIFEFQPVFNEKHLTCTLDAPANLLILADANKLERVFDNLIRNAVSYSFENSEICITACENEKGVALTFMNRGAPIPKHKLSQIFEQFYRLDSSRSTRGGGAGLGLAIAKEIVELHKGEITALSEEDWIEFRIFLPNTLSS